MRAAPGHRRRRGSTGPGWESITTPHDLAVIYRAALTYPLIAQIMRQRSAQFPGKTITNQNELLTRYPGTIAGKTGFTNLARDTFVAAAQRGNRRLMVVEMYGDGDLYGQAIGLFDWGFAQACAGLLAHHLGRRRACDMVLEILAVAAAGLAASARPASSTKPGRPSAPLSPTTTSDCAPMKSPAGRPSARSSKRVDTVQFLRPDRHRPVLLTGKRYGERPPRRADVVGVGGQRLAHVGPDTVDVNMQLVLGPRVSGVDGEAQPVAGQFAPCALFDEGTGPPRVGEIVRRIGGQDLRALDSRRHARSGSAGTGSRRPDP